jgi:hypothetical protein
MVSGSYSARTFHRKMTQPVWRERILLVQSSFKLCNLHSKRLQNQRTLPICASDADVASVTRTNGMLPLGTVRSRHQTLKPPFTCASCRWKRRFQISLSRYSEFLRAVGCKLDNRNHCMGELRGCQINIFWYFIDDHIKVVSLAMPVQVSLLHRGLHLTFL